MENKTYKWNIKFSLPSLAINLIIILFIVTQLEAKLKTQRLRLQNYLQSNKSPIFEQVNETGSYYL